MATYESMNTQLIHSAKTFFQIGNDLVNMDHVLRISLEEDGLNVYTLEQVSDDRGMFGNKKHTIAHPSEAIVNILIRGIPDAIDTREVLNIRIVTLDR
ncbi:MAG: hypothetical protein GY866_12490 [Proteobacteria bacterium]|nr:hypothetical protein [Pseudomonadota bacterium]